MTLERQYLNIQQDANVWVDSHDMAKQSFHFGKQFYSHFGEWQVATPPIPGTSLHITSL